MLQIRRGSSHQALIGGVGGTRALAHSITECCLVVINVSNRVHRYHLLLPSGPIGHPVQVEGVQPRGNEPIPLGNPEQAEQEGRQGSCVQGVLVGFQAMLLINAVPPSQPMCHQKCWNYQLVNPSIS